MNIIEFTNEQSRVAILLFAENLEKQLKKPVLVTSKTDVWEYVLELSKKYNQSFVTNVTTPLVKQAVYEISSLDMLRELVENFGCYLVFIRR